MAPSLQKLALAISFVTIVEASRDVVSFDFGWKHRTGLHAWAPADEPAPTDVDPGLHPAEAQPAYNASDWIGVQLPHDGLIANSPSTTACPGGCSGKSFLPRHVLWYRKTFNLPASWAGSAIWLDFGASFRNTSVWINGHYASNHECGYTPFRVRLDNITAINVGGINTIAVFVDPDNGDAGGKDHGSGWWYEGGGLYRSANLVRASTLHIEQDGLFAYSNVTFVAGPGDNNPTAVLHARAAVANTGSIDADACVTFSLIEDTTGKAAADPQQASISVAAGSSAEASTTLAVAAPQLWASATPHLYTVTADVVYGKCSLSGTAENADSISVVHGFRSLRYDANNGFFLNNAHFKVRGFCDHNNFGVVGMAVPERINLFRAQASRAVGGNGRRTSHNPPDSSMLEIYDRIGIVVMDENRLFNNDTKDVINMGALVKRDRNHPSVVIWSFCNEGGCEGSHESGGPRFQAISQQYDGTRPTLANMFTFGDLLSNTIDVQGFSHQSRQKLDSCHASLPHKPIYMSECCSCNTMRDEDVGCETLHDNPHKICTQTSFNARCAESNDATNASDGVDYAAGTMVWTLFDYYGEPPVGGPEISSTYGQYDLVGFPKASAFWYRTQWLLTIADGPDKTFSTQGAHEVHIVESWESPDNWNQTKGNTTRVIHAYTSAASVELYVNNKTQGSRAVITMNKGPGSYAEWLEVPWEAGELRAVARDESGSAVATATRFTNAAGKGKLAVSIDAPSAMTGTGTAVLLDGHDVAMIRASILDAEGRVQHFATDNVTFRVVSGPGTIQGTGNGDPHSQLANDSPWHTAYHGLVRAVVRVNSGAGRPVAERALLAAIDVDGPMAAGNTAQRIVDEQLRADPEPIIVEASAPGFEAARVTIATSTDVDTHSVFASAAAAAGKPVDFFGHSSSHSV